jgi:hypothetical protein
MLVQKDQPSAFACALTRGVLRLDVTQDVGVGEEAKFAG